MTAYTPNQKPTMDGNMNRIIGIDIGATRIKSALVNVEDGEVLGLRQTPFPKFAASTDPLVKETETHEVWGAVLGHLSCRHKEPGDEAVPIYICNQQGSFVPCKTPNVPATSFVPCKAPHGYDPCGLARSGFLEPPRGWAVRHKVERGERMISWMDGRCKVYRPTTVQRMQACGLWHGDYLPMSIGDWVAAMLCGWDHYWHFKCHWSQRHGSDGEQGDNRLCDVLETGEVVGYWERHPVVAPIGDWPCAVHGVDLQDDEVSVNCGTGCQVAMLWHGQGAIEPPMRKRGLGNVSLGCVTHLPGGRALAANEISPLGIARWVAQAARTLRPFRKVKLSGGVCEEGVVDRWEERNSFNSALIEELGEVEFEIVDNATFKGMARITRERSA